MSARAVKRLQALVDGATPVWGAVIKVTYADLRAVLALAKRCEDAERRIAELKRDVKAYGEMPCSCFPWLLARLDGEHAALAPRKGRAKMRMCEVVTDVPRAKTGRRGK